MFAQLEGMRRNTVAWSELAAKYSLVCDTQKETISKQDKLISQYDAQIKQFSQNINKIHTDNRVLEARLKQSAKRTRWAVGGLAAAIGILLIQAL
jgi:septal ring factor EnvC (AmiA/AmiB activator)